MYKVLVVDDEQVIRKGVAKMIDNDIEGFYCAGMFGDGIEVIEYLQNNDADVIISDIKMINVSGVELAKYVYENYSHIKVVLLSGYSEFEYAKAAVRYKVTDYILKPTDFDELKKVFDSIREELSDDTLMRERKKFNERTQILFSSIRDNDSKPGHDLIDSVIKEVPRNTGEYLCDLFEIIYERLESHSKIKPGVFRAEIAEEEAEALKERAHNMFDELFEMFNGTDDELTQVVKKYIDQHFCEDISLQSVSDAVALSPVYLSRFFKKNIGENFSDYILELRMEKAARMLLENKLVAEVSEKCGFNNSGYFARVFKNYYNCTPKEYIRKMKK